MKYRVFREFLGLGVASHMITVVRNIMTFILNSRKMKIVKKIASFIPSSHHYTKRIELDNPLLRKDELNEIVKESIISALNQPIAL